MSTDPIGRGRQRRNDTALLIGEPFPFPGSTEFPVQPMRERHRIEKRSVFFGHWRTIPGLIEGVLLLVPDYSMMRVPRRLDNGGHSGKTKKN